MKKLTNFILSLVLAVTAFTFFAPVPSATADTESGTYTLIKKAPIINGELKANSTKKIPAFDVRSAILSFSEPETTGSLDGISIVLDPDGAAKKEFGCPSLQDIQGGDDLVVLCGGPAILEAGLTEYSASGTFSAPGNPEKIEFTVTLSNAYSDAYKEKYGTEDNGTVGDVQSLYGL